MKFGRRGLLAALALAGCTPDPTISGAPAPAPPPPTPTQAPAARSAAEALAVLAATVAAGRAPHGAEYALWADGADAALAAVTARLLAADPVAGGDPVFPAPEPRVAPHSTAAETTDALTRASGAAVDVLRPAVLNAESQPLRLLYASGACTAHALRAPGPSPVAGDAEPTHFQDTSEEAALAVALSHTWALVYGLGLGLGRLEGSDELETLGIRRLAAAKELRNELRAWIATPPLQPASFAMPTPMGTAEEIRDGWARLELGLLAAMGRLVAAGGPALERRLDLLLEQGDAVTGLGRPLPHWPGWA